MDEPGMPSAPEREPSWLWTSQDMIRIADGRSVGSLPDGISGISLNARVIGKSDAFFAVKGDRIDGHDVARIAVANGAVVIVVSEARFAAVQNLPVPMIVVDDVLAALEKLAIASRERSRARIVAITGSVGKTTTKEMLRQALEPSGKVHASTASFNDHLGVPLTLACMPADCNFGVFEIGLIHEGDIRPLVKMVRPHVAMITKIAAAHMGNHGNLDNIAVAKAEILEGVEAGGVVILNRDDMQFSLLEDMAQAAGISRICTFGRHDGADARLLAFEGDEEGSKVQTVIFGETAVVTIAAPGDHMAENAMAVLAACRLVGADLAKAIGELGQFTPLKGRGLRHRLATGDGCLTLIDESYNGSPASMRAAIAILAATKVEPGGRRVAVLGDMLEMGKLSRELHAQLAEPLVAAGVGHVWLAGAQMAALRDALPETMVVEYRSTVTELADFVIGSVAANDVLMVKSSLATGFRRIVDALIKRYPPAGS